MGRIRAAGLVSLLCVTAVCHAATAGIADQGLFSLFELHRQAGRLTDAQAVLVRLDERLSPATPERAELANAFARIGQPATALNVWNALIRHGFKPNTDQQMQIATLDEGQQRWNEALGMWRALFAEQLPAAQRSVVEERIVDLAGQQGRLGDLAVELEEKHIAGAATCNDGSLLVRLYVRAGQKSSAVEAIEEYFPKAGAGPLEVLQEQAQVYRLLRDSPAYERIMSKLIELDPKNRSRYLHALILDKIERGGADRIVVIRRLLEQLRAADGGASTTQFEGGVLTLAGFGDEAISAYERAIGATPGSGDAYLLLGNALIQRGRQNEAIALFQTLAETASTDELFVTAADGLLNVLAPMGAESTDRQAHLTFTWMQVQLLERLIARGDAFYLYRIISDVAGASGEPLRAIAAIEHSLPLADALRPAVLRELLTLATPKSDAAGSGGVSGEMRDALKKRLTYGRRLLALGNVLPPEIYLGVGRDFLALNDTRSASHAFSLAADITARRNLRGQVATLYDQAGFDDAAIRQYRAALLVEPGDVRVMLNLALVLERLGQREEANDTFGKALLSVLSQQPALVQTDRATADVIPGQIQGKTSATTRDYGLYYAPLLRGYLGTWPAGSAQEKGSLTRLEDSFTGELRNAVGQSVNELVFHVRLNRLSEFVRRVAFATGHPQLADRVQAALLDRFGTDTGLRDRLEQERQAWQFGSGDVSRTAGALLSFETVLAKAEHGGDFNQALSLSLLNHDQDEMYAAARSWLRSGNYGAPLKWAGDEHMDASRQRNLCRYAGQLLHADPRFESEAAWQQFSGVAAQVDSCGERPIFSETELLRTFAAEDSKEQTSITDETAAYLVRRLAPARLLRLASGIAARSAAVSTALGSQDAALWSLIALWRQALKMPLGVDTISKLANVVTLRLEHDQVALEAPTSMAQQLLEPDVDPANAELANQVATEWRRHTGGKIDYYRPLLLLKAGKTSEALEAFIAVATATTTAISSGQDILDSVAGPMTLLRPVFIPRYTQELRARLDEMEGSSGAAEKIIGVRYSLFFADDKADPAEATAFLEHAIAVSPKKEWYLAHLQRLYQRSGQDARSLELLERLHALDPGHLGYRAYLYAAYIGAGREADALELNEASPEDMATPRFFATLTQRSGLAVGAGQMLEPPPWALAQQAAPANPKNPGARVAAALAAQDPKAVHYELRRLWQQVTAPSEESSLREEPLTYREILALSLPFGREELEDNLRSAQPRDEEDIYPIYESLAKAYGNEGRAEENVARLTRAVTDGNANLHDFTLWLALAAIQPGRPAAETMRTLDVASARAPDLSQRQLLLMARVYASAEQFARAAGIYQMLAIQLPRLGQGGFQRRASEVDTSQITPALLEKEVSLHLDDAQRRRALEDLERLFKPLQGASEGSTG